MKKEKNNTKTNNIQKKKRKIIVLLCIFAILLMFCIGIGAGALAFNLMHEDESSKTGDLNTLLEENQNTEVGNNVMLVEMDEPNVQEPPKNEEPKTNNNQETEAKYYLKVNNQANVVTAYKKDSNEKYTVPVRAMICSIGTATPKSGVYSMTDKYTWRLLERKCLWTICM